MKKKVTVWGIGNPLYGDDRAGIVAAEMLKKDSPAWLQVQICDTTPGNYIATLKRDLPDVLILIDASNMGLPSGAMRRMSLADLRDISFTSHDVSIDLMLEPFAKSMEICIIGIQPSRLEISEELSDDISESVERLVCLLRKGQWKEIPDLHEE